MPFIGEREKDNIALVHFGFVYVSWYDFAIIDAYINLKCESIISLLFIHEEFDNSVFGKRQNNY